MCKTAWTPSLMSNDIRRRGKPSSKRDYNISNAERAWYKTREECVLGCLGKGGSHGCKSKERERHRRRG
jgi:hypothetical protein